MRGGDTVIKRAVITLTMEQLTERLMGVLHNTPNVVGIHQSTEDKFDGTVTVLLEGDDLPDDCEYIEGQTFVRLGTRAFHSG